MAKLQFVLFAVAVAVTALIAVSSAAQRPQRTYRLAAAYNQRQRSFSARQAVAAEEDIAAVTPYPSADELKPEVPFEEGVAAAAAADGKVTPDPVYGPPEFASADAESQPDEVYGPPEVNGNGIAAENPTAEVLPAPVDEPQARLVAAQRRAQRLQQQQQEQQRQFARSRAVNGATAGKLRSLRRSN